MQIKAGIKRFLKASLRLFTAFGVIVAFLMLIQVVNVSFSDDKINYLPQSLLKFTDSATYYVKSLKIPEEIDLAGDKVPIESFDVRESLDREITTIAFQHGSTLLTMKRSGRFFPIIEPILKECGIPDEFKYLAVAESNLQNATSSVGAKGFWQFMEATAKSHGLEVNEFVDERFNLEKSTRAACDYLSGGYKRMNNWALVAATYNAGSGRIKGHMEDQNQADYYDLWVNPETARYVFRIIAYKLIMSHPENFGYQISKEDLYKPVECKIVEVDSTISNLVDFAEKNKTTYKMIKLMNPWLKSSKLPVKSGKIYQIKIPVETDIYLLKKDSISLQKHKP